MASRVSNEVLNRAHQVIEQLHSLRQELSQPAADPSSGLATHKIPLDVARQLKNAVDEFRMFMWAYLDVWAPVTIARKLVCKKSGSKPQQTH
jgi:hypothetical protein